MMRFAAFLAATYLLPGLAGAVLWRRLAVRWSPARRWDSVVWLAASPYIVAGAYYVALRLAPGRSAQTYAIALPVAFALPLLVLPRETVGTVRELRDLALRALRGAWLRPRARKAALVALIPLAALWLRVGSMTLNRPLWQHDAVIYASRAMALHATHSMTAWHPDKANDRGFVWFQSTHGPGFELLNAWAADWVPYRLADASLRSISLACHVGVLLLLVVLTRGAGRWAPVWAAWVFLVIPEIPFHVWTHQRASFRVLGGLLFLAAVHRTWRRRLPQRIAAIALGGAAALAGHTLGILASGMVALAWCAAHYRQLPRAAIAFGIALPLAIALGGRTYVSNALSEASVKDEGGQYITGEAAHAIQALRGAPAGGLRDLPGKLEVMLQPRTALVFPLAAFAVVMVLATPRARRTRLLWVTALLLVGHLVLVVGAADALYGELSPRLAYNERYKFHMYGFLAVLLPWALRVLRGRPWRRGLVGGATVACLGAGFWWSWTQPLTGMEWRHHVYPDWPRALGEAPAVDARVLWEIERLAGRDLVLEAELPDLYYATSVRGRSYRDPVLAPVLYAVRTPRAQRDVLWGAGVRYVVLIEDSSWGPLWPARLDALGLSGLVADERAARPVLRARLLWWKTLAVYALVPPAGPS